MERRGEEIPGERTGLVRKVTNVAVSEIAGDAGAPFAAVTSGLPTIQEEAAWRDKSIRPSHLAVDGLHEGFNVSVTERERLETARIIRVTRHVIRTNRA